MRRRNNTHQPHHIQINGETATLTAYTKKGVAVEAVFDADRLEAVKAFENWRAVWSTEFDTYVVENKAFSDGHAVRAPLFVAVLDCSPNAPVRHINGDVRDNRFENLEIFDVLGQPNRYEVTEAGVEVQLKDRYGRVVGTALLDEADLAKTINDAHVWLKKQRASGQPYVVDQSGRLLAHHVLDVTEGFVTYINKNPLDNRRKNLEIK